jgi:hypothetical protein
MNLRNALSNAFVGSGGGADATKLPLTGGTLTGPLTITGGAVTDSTPLLALTQTWNDVADTFRAITLDITDTASAEFSSFFRATRGGTQFFSLCKKTAWGINNMPTLEGDGSGAGQVCFNSPHGTVILARKDAGWSWVTGNNVAFAPSGAQLGFAANSTTSAVLIAPDAFFMRAAAASIQMGANSATPIDQTFKGPNGSGTNIAGGDIRIAPGQSAGNATPATVVLQGTAAGSSGTTAQTLVDVLTVVREGVIRITNIPTSSAGLSTGDIYSNAGILTIV